MRVAAWVDLYRTRWTCTECEQSPDLRAARGHCGGPISSELYTCDDGIESPFVLGAGARLHPFRTCPLALVRAYRSTIDRVWMECDTLRRFRCRSDPSVPIELCRIYDAECDAVRLQMQRDAERERSTHARMRDATR